MKQAKEVSIRNIVKEYVSPDGKNVFRAVDDISLEIKPGEFVTLLGPSGCGKTTTLRMIGGFENPTSGEIHLGGEHIDKKPPNERDTAMVFQSYALFPHYTVYDNIAYGIKLQGMNKTEIKAKVKNSLEMVGLHQKENRYPNQLSGGEQQRVALARALIMEPGVLLFDEPLSNLDAKLRIHMRSEIRKIQQGLGITSVYVTHDQAEAMSLSDRIIVMNKGVIEQVGTPMEIYRKPRTKFIAEFIGNANFVPTTVRAMNNGDAEVEFLGNVIQVPVDPGQVFGAGGSALLVIRPETISFAEEGIDAVIESAVYMGETWDYVVSCNGVTLSVKGPGRLDSSVYPAGSRVKLHFEPESLACVLP